MVSDPEVTAKAWLSGEAVSYNGWDKGTPNGEKGGVCFYAQGNSFDARNPTEKGQGYVCEKPPGGMTKVPGKYTPAGTREQQRLKKYNECINTWLLFSSLQPKLTARLVGWLLPLPASRLMMRRRLGWRPSRLARRLPRLSWPLTSIRMRLTSLDSPCLTWRTTGLESGTGRCTVDMVLTSLVTYFIYF